MRIHGIHVQGLRAPTGQHRLRLDPGYNVLLTRDEQGGAGLAALLCAFLYPRTDLGNLELWRDPAAGLPSRAGLAFASEPDVFRLIMDLDKQRLVLGRHDSESNEYQRVCTDLGEIEARLRAAGLPSREEFMTLQLCQGLAEAETEPTPPPELSPRPPRFPHAELPAERERLQQELSQAKSAQSERAAAERRVGELRQLRDRLAVLEHEHQALTAEVQRRAEFGSEIEELNGRLNGWRDEEAQLGRERANSEHSRRELLDERTALRRIPARQALPLWIGLILAVLGSLAGFAGHPLFYVFGPLGAATVLGALLISRKARRRMGTIEARLAALRVRERGMERNFELHSAPLRELMGSAGVGTLEELAQRSSDYHKLVGRAHEVERELAETRNALPKVEEELRQLEALLAAPVDLPDPAEIRENLAQLSKLEAALPVADVVPRQAPAPQVRGRLNALDRMVHAATLASGLSEAEVFTRLASIVPVYVRALSVGQFTQLERREFEGWLLRAQAAGETVRYEGLSDAQRFSVELGFRLALLEIMAPALSVPLILGPTLPVEQGEARVAMARALHRLSSAVQVIHIAVGGGPWLEHADRSHVM
ncbi:MAG: hypothetical protein E2O73_15695 [Deltaproteobacteria bacterium]|nr:MAG: hypothetical protein E2O73_15695 [Deltaproteobacteria bacterium]TDJ09643.1 MAG: hypothetical protein E2O71_01885 [Deltaproteobacteria bacterium]